MPTSGKNRPKLLKLYIYRYFLSVLIILPIFACVISSQKKNTKFDHIKCMDTIPSMIKGLKVLSGPRTEQSIIQDLIPVNCYAQNFFRKMISEGQDINAGDVIFRVTVEYSGEAYSASVEKTSIQSKLFVRRVADMIMDHDFIGWTLYSEDSVFLYPMSFSN